MSIKFKKEKEDVSVLTANNESILYTIEFRWDPLTSDVAVICPHLAKKWTEFYNTCDKNWISKIITDSMSGCPFCKPTIDKIVAKFSKDQIDKDIIKHKGIYVFPNLFPRTTFEAVVTKPEIHYLQLGEFDKDILFDFLQASFMCIRKAYHKNKRLQYPVIGCNYMPTAGASLTHFHMQVSIQEFPFPRIESLIYHSNRYKSNQNSSFWKDLKKCNKNLEIKEQDNIYWYVPFAPKGFCEIRASIGKSNFLEFGKDEIKFLAKGLSDVLRYYDACGFSAFNFVIYSGNMVNAKDNCVSGVEIIARPNPQPNHINIDSWYMPLLLGQTVVLNKPEETVKEIKQYFND